MKDKTKRQLKECYEHMEPYIKDENCTEELRTMCKSCELYCGIEHDFTECREKICFQFWLAWQYLEWVNSFGGY